MCVMKQSSPAAVGILFESVCADIMQEILPLVSPGVHILKHYKISVLRAGKTG